MPKRMTVATLLIVILGVFVLTACNAKIADTRDNDWKKFDAALPDFDNIYQDQAAAEAAGGGWFLTVNEDFNYSSVSELFYDPETNPDSIWTYSPHALRWEPNGETSKNYADWEDKNKAKANWWCPDMIEVSDGIVKVKSAQYTKDNPHVCSGGICPSEGRFTSGIETRRIVTDPNDALAVKGGANNDQMLFAQAYGYYECRVKFPKVDGMWSAFWLQSSYQRKVGNGGADGTEIDIYESAFLKSNKNGKSWMGHALLWDGYASDCRVADAKLPLDYDLYDGNYHTFALKWTPTHYVFYIDGQATWATNAGGVARVAEYMRLTCEIDAGDEWGPHGQEIGAFHPSQGDSTFYIDSVKVLQHTSFLGAIMRDADFVGTLDPNN